jgi:hypothetical protein
MLLLALALLKMQLLAGTAGILPSLNKTLHGVYTVIACVSAFLHCSHTIDSASTQLQHSIITTSTSTRNNDNHALTCVHARPCCACYCSLDVDSIVQRIKELRAQKHDNNNNNSNSDSPSTAEVTLHCYHMYIYVLSTRPMQ